MELQYTLDKAAVIKDWVKSVKEGSFVSVGHVILTCEEVSTEGDTTNNKLIKIQRIKATKAGVVEKLLVSKGDTVTKGTPILRLGPCTHPTVMREMCAECGMDLRKLDEPNPMSASVSMVHAIPELRVSMEQAQRLGKVDEERLLDKRKLVLLVDLDQTLIHTTNDDVPNNLKDVFHFQLWGHGSAWYHTRLRPHTKEFLDTISELYELHICTFGTRHYAYTIAHQLDSSKKLFSDRILSRDECFSQNSKTANLKELFPRGDHMVCIIDDREDVWNFAPNLIHVKPYHFFRHTGDINAPPGLSKKDQDDKIGFKFDGDKVDGSLPSSNSSESSKDNEIASEKVKDESDIATSRVNDVATDLNLSEDDDSEKDSSKEEAAQDADMEESNDEDTQKLNQNAPPNVDKKAESNPAETVDENKPIMEVDGVEKEGCKNTLSTVSSDDHAHPVSTENEDAVDASISDSSNQSNINNSSSDSENKSKSEGDSDNSKVLEVDDDDDYLLYLEQILKSIHEAFYSLYDDTVKRKESNVPDVKSVIPYVRKKVLKNVSVVFSGVVPTHIPLIKSKAFQIAIGLGAHVSDKVIPPVTNKAGAFGAEPTNAAKPSERPTTHIVAARMGTAKVNEARRYKGIHIVTPEWLWTCAERWEHVEEKLYRLEKAKNVKRNPPAHCSSPSPDFRREKFECLTPIDGPDEVAAASSSGSQPAVRKMRTPSGRFMDTINPLLSFSAGEIETMANEVDDIFNESESSSSDDEEELQKEKERAARRRSSRSLSGQEHTLEDPSASELTKESLSSSSTSDSSESDDDEFGGRKDRSHHRKRKRQTETETEDEPLSVRFRRGEPLPSDIDSLNLRNPSSSDDENYNDEQDEGNEEDAWMARELERELVDENSRSQDSYADTR